MRKAINENRRRTWRLRQRRRALVVAGEFRLPERPARWELDLVVGPLLERLQRSQQGAANGDDDA